MKGSTMLATLQRLGVVASFSRPSVSNDNPFVESFFRTLKCCPGYPSGSFESLQAAREWVAVFVRWYNSEHLHSGINFVTPNQRHEGREEAIFSRRRQVYATARQEHPERWSRSTRKWESVKEVRLNPEKCNANNAENQAAA